MVALVFYRSCCFFLGLLKRPQSTWAPGEVALSKSWKTTGTVRADECALGRLFVFFFESFGVGLEGVKEKVFFFCFFNKDRMFLDEPQFLF